MARRLPSLNALKAFEAAARHVSFTEAAGELFVTHAAISRHIRELEEYLDVFMWIIARQTKHVSTPRFSFQEQFTDISALFLAQR